MPEKTSLSEAIFTVSEVVSARKCRKLVYVAERDGFQPAPPDVITEEQTFHDVRTCSHHPKRHPRWAMSLWRRLHSFIPDYQGLRAVNIDDRFSFERFESGQSCRWHKDPQRVLRSGERSWLSMVVFLNHNFEGGAVQFLETSVRPQLGMALFYPHHLPHEDKLVLGGSKFVLRSRVIYEDPAGTTDVTLPLE